VAAARGELALERAAAGAHAEALDETRRAVLSAQRAGLREQQYRLEWQLGRLLRDVGRAEDAALAYSAAVATLDATAVAAATTRRGFRRHVLPLYEEYADLVLAATRGKSGEDVTATLRVVQRHLEALRLAEVRNYFENQCSVPDVALTTPVAERTVVIYPMLFADRLELLVGTAGDLRQVSVDVSAAELTAVVNLLRNAIERNDAESAYLRQARALYDWIVAPLDGLLAANEPSTLVFVPDGALRTIPLAVLHDGERFLVERYALATTPGLSLATAGEPAQVTRVLVNGLIEPTAGFAGLPFVAEELRSIEQAFPARVYTDDDFVTATLEREIVTGGYSIVHMATHAQFEADYRRSFLLAHDDVITMDRLEDVMGSQRFTDRPVDLLVLSACRTAAGDERAALGLAGVAVKAGARSALASLWSVNDESTAKLVGEFYRRLGDDAGKAAALRGAQLLLLNDERYSHPVHWAPFLMIGDWR
jgi:CHAT domain-containing protein